MTVDTLRRRAWITFATGLEGFNIPIMYVIFAPYFATTVIGDKAKGQEIWGYVAGWAGLAAMLLAPVLAFAAENPARRRWMLSVAVLVNAVAALFLWNAAPGAESAALLTVLIAAGVAMAANDFCYVFWGGMLPEVAPPAILGRVSGAATAIAWALGLVMTIGFLALFVLPDTPALGLDKAAGEPERLTGPLAGVVLLVFAAPLLLTRAPPTKPKPKTAFLAWIREEFASLLAERAVAWAVAARLVYWSGVVLVMVFGNIYATGLFDWDATGSAAFGLAVLAASVLGAAGGGVLDDRLGSRNALILGLLGLAACLAAILGVEADRLFGVIAVAPPVAEAPPLASTAERVMIGLGVLTGVFLGSVGPISRTLLSRLAPPGRVVRYFGFATLAGNMTNVVGPFAVAYVTSLTGDQRLGLLVGPAFLIVGAAMLLRLPAAKP